MGRSRSYLNLATVYFELGDHGSARKLLDLCWRDRSNVLEPNDPQLLAVKERFGDLELNAGELQKAHDLLLEYASSASEKLGPRSEEYIRAIAKLGRVLAEQGRYQQADSLFALSIDASMAARDPRVDPMLFTTLRDRAIMRERAGRWPEASVDLDNARAIMVNIQDSLHFKVAEVDVLRSELAFAAGQHKAALRHAERALHIIDDRITALKSNGLPRAFPEPHILPDAIYWKVRSEMALAGTDPSAEDWNEWNADIDLAVDALARNKAAMADEASKLLLVAAQKQLFDLAVDVAFRSRKALGDEAAGRRFLAVSEAGRSTLLKERLNGFKGIRFAGLPDSLIALEQELLVGLEIGGQKDGRTNELERNERAFIELQRRLERDHPAYFALRYGEATVSVEEIRRSLLRPGRALVTYARTGQGLYALVITMDGIDLVELDAASLVEDVRGLNTSIADRDAERFTRMAYGLHQQLVAPLSDLIAGQELLIIPDGPLHLLNFECLLSAPSTPADFKRHLLLQDHAIAYLLSATTAVQFAQLARERVRGTLALAPGFTDELKRDYLARVTDSSQVDRDFLRYVRQPFAMRTAEGLGGSMRASLLLGAEATERGFRDGAGKHGILHLGTHAEMNPSNPMYSRLVLSKDGTGVDPDADGYLHAYEIYELDLRAQLAVLTACGTGTGKNDGEGVRSLGYGFAYAGCPSLVMSLWSIDEKTSSTIITRFYELLADGLPKHEALRQAKLDHLDSAVDELALPYYWAGLVLVGDVEPVEMDTAWPWTVILITVALFLFVLLVVVRMRKS
jgi:CHAT domain-containing protein